MSVEAGVAPKAAAADAAPGEASPSAAGPAPTPPPWFGVVRAVAGKDLAIEFRTRSRSATMAGFVVLVGVLLNFSIDRSLVRPVDIASALVWITLVLAGLIGVGRTFAIEGEDGALDGLLRTPAPRDAIYLGKVIANFVLVYAIVLLTVGVFGLFFQLDYGSNLPVLLGSLAIGTLGFVALATLFGALTASTRLGESLLPILLFPLLVPMVVYGASAAGRLIAERPVSEVAGQIRMLAAFAVLAVGAGAALFGQIVEE